MPSESLPIVPTKGIVRTPAVLWKDKGSFFNLTNARLVPGGGAIKQTDMFITSATWTAGTYYDGGSKTESSSLSSSLIVNLNGTVFSFGQVARSGSTQLQVIRQTSVPAGETVNTGCLLVVNDYAALAITLGNTFEVRIQTDATHFGWRKNGGAWSADIPITTTGVSVDSGNATVYFLASSGFDFTTPATWVWTRTDYLSETTGVTLAYNWDYTVSGSRIYFVDAKGRVLVYDNGGVRSVGYRPVYGTHLTIFDDHLYVGSYNTSGSTTRTDVVANSDKTDLDNFIPTDVNEADTYTLRPNELLDNTQISAGVYGLSVINGLLYCYTSTRIWYTPALGLPNVNNWKEYRSVALWTRFYRPISTPAGDYFVTLGGICFFNGGEITIIDSDVSYYRAVDILNSQWGGYDSLRREVYFFVNDFFGGAVALVFQEESRTWFRRTALFTSGEPPKSMCIISTALAVTKALGYAVEDTLGNGNVVLDTTPPSIEFNDVLSDTLSVVGGINEVHMDNYYPTASGGAYGVTGIKLQVATREYANAPVVFVDCLPTWTSSTTTGQISTRASGRIIRFKLVPTLTSTKACFGWIFNGLVLHYCSSKAAK
jgi:hypothetical protein